MVSRSSSSAEKSRAGFTKVKGGVLVRTEETHAGEQVEANVPAATETLGQGLEGWLDSLKTTAGARAGHRHH